MDAAGDISIVLPPPTGEFPTGTVLLHLRDDQRPDPLDPAGAPRELMVQVWYPAAATDDLNDAPVAAYAPVAEAAALQQFYPIPAGAFTAETNSRIGAPVAGTDHPVVFFHHGLCGARSDSTIVAEQLASAGYVVVALGNTYEMPAVAFPDGRVLMTSDPAFCAAGADPYSEAGQQVLQRLLEVRVADTSFTADQLVRIAAGDNPDVDGAVLPTGLAGAMDLTAMGMYGHSFGGGTAAAVLAADDRFVAGVDLDGFIIGEVATTGLSKPFLVVGSSYHDATFDPSWTTFLPALTGERQWIGVADAGHYRFIDLGGSVVRWGLDQTLKAQDPTTWEQVFGNVDDAASQDIDRALVIGWFDRYLRGLPAPILDYPTAAFPNLIDRTAEIG